ncbi:PEP-CTERM sorting domain-containing protein [Microcystis aeruginosa CS-564/01]|uniref:PEP-CTERM sorting domain-containing protein n=1 Tax=Microcystis aeruginosa TaxID=1126 RepID=UPI0023309BC2|nr:PEP-CTERM sorting domain-containing protein [Microcystis aeruginosa]MDB9414538.1 PEP-CTERM sorting domain-containing protein [Microcystis aeruginosa CS-567/02]MDB9426004.1 PEP-CTERM sorting domain-containing protein [Microcystis aeruginosa CS-564/01]
MMTTNKLTKTFASGSLAIGVLAGSVFAATSASAAGILTWAQWTGTSTTLGTPLTAGDKKVTFVPVGGNYNPIGAEAGDEVSLMLIGDEYDFVYDAVTAAAPTPNSNSGSFTYTIEVVPTSPNFLTAVALDSDVTTTYGTVTKTFAEIPNVLVSVNGSSDPAIGVYPIAPIKKLTVTDTLAANPGEALFTLNNAYKQTPEPGTILGLLAVGGLGMVSRFKKQK